MTLFLGILGTVLTALTGAVVQGIVVSRTKKNIAFNSELPPVSAPLSPTEFKVLEGALQNAKGNDPQTVHDLLHKLDPKKTPVAA